MRQSLVFRYRWKRNKKRKQDKPLLFFRFLVFQKSERKHNNSLFLFVSLFSCFLTFILFLSFESCFPWMTKSCHDIDWILWTMGKNCESFSFLYITRNRTTERRKTKEHSILCFSFSVFCWDVISCSSFLLLSFFSFSHCFSLLRHIETFQ